MDRVILRVGLESIDLVDMVRSTCAALGMPEDKIFEFASGEIFAHSERELGSGRIVSGKLLRRYVWSEIKLRLPAIDLFRWRRDEWIEGEDYFSDRSDGRNEFVYNLDRIMPFFVAYKRKKKKNPGSRLMHDEEHEVRMAKKAAKLVEETGPRIRGYAG